MATIYHIHMYICRPVCIINQMSYLWLEFIGVGDNESNVRSRIYVLSSGPQKYAMKCCQIGEINQSITQIILKQDTFLIQLKTVIKTHMWTTTYLKYVNFLNFWFSY